MALCGVEGHARNPLLAGKAGAAHILGLCQELASKPVSSPVTAPFTKRCIRSWDASAFRTRLVVRIGGSMDINIHYVWAGIIGWSAASLLAMAFLSGSKVGGMRSE